ncbi:MAG TPA: hypothetical protein VGJ18_03200 [Gemmatimonadaceae bacterium]
MSAEAVRSESPQTGSGVPVLARDELRSLVVAWTLKMREDGMLPEKVLIAVKTLAKETVAPSVVPSDYDAQLRQELLADASQLCINTYFNTTGSKRAD